MIKQTDPGYSISVTARGFMLVQGQPAGGVKIILTSGPLAAAWGTQSLLSCSIAC